MRRLRWPRRLRRRALGPPIDPAPPTPVHPINPTPRVTVVMDDGERVALVPDERVGYVAENLISPRSGRHG